MPSAELARHFTTSDFDFELPPELIAQHPASERSGSRLLDGRGAALVDRLFKVLPELLSPGDLLVFNDTQVVKARLFGEKATGGKLELLIERVLDDAANGVANGVANSAATPSRRVAAHMKVSKKPRVGDVLHMAGGLAGGFTATLLGRWPHAHGPLYEFELSGDPFELMQQHGHVPLPPYITHPDDAQDESRYQTVFAKHPGAVAAPTAALHFDADVLAALAARGVQTASVTLHVGAGTFQPMKTEQIADHVMHHERYIISSNTAAQILDKLAKKPGKSGKIVAVGTTTVRSLESWAVAGMPAQGCSGDTNIFITPGFEFQVVDRLITNFHLPKSTLMMLVSAFAGYEHIMGLYRHAIAERYRFFSYGDAMLLDANHGRSID